MNNPVIFITLAYCLGILCGSSLNLPIILTALFILIFSFITLIGLLRKIEITRCFIILFFLLGGLNFQVHNLPDAGALPKLADDNHYYSITGIVDELPREQADYQAVDLKISAVNGIKANGIIGASLPLNPKLEYGDEISLRGKIEKREMFYYLRSNYFDFIRRGGGSAVRKLCFWLNANFNRDLNLILPPQQASLLGSILLGTGVSVLPQDLMDKYRRAGLIHLLVVSGTQVSILIGLCLAFTRTIGLKPWPGFFITSAINLLLVLITGAGASIVRAAIMGELAMLAELLERSRDPFNALALSALILLLFQPQYLLDIGFQLSFAATWALLYLAPALEKKIPQLLALSTAPIIATWPIIAFHFGQISPGAIVSNLLVLPWVEFLVILGIIATALGFVFLPLAKILGGTVWLMLILLDKIAELVANFPGATFYLPAPGFAMIAVYYLVLIGLIENMKQGNRLKINQKKVIFILLLFCFSIVWRIVVFDGLKGKELTVTFLDVGQGDCIFIESPLGRKVLIDGGGLDAGEEGKGKLTANLPAKTDPIGSRIVLPFLQKKGINYLDAVILSHPHADHLAGLNVVLSKIAVGMVLDGGQIYDSAAYRNFLSMIRDKKIKYVKARAGEKIAFDSQTRAFILNPSIPFIGNPNDDSIAMRLVYGNKSFFFTGDLGFAGEERISPLLAHADVLKVGHHGSATSSSDQFLNTLDPGIAVISVGIKNRYRHPAQQTLRRLQAHAIRILRTDQDGTIEMKSDGEKIAVTYRK